MPQTSDVKIEIDLIEEEVFEIDLYSEDILNIILESEDILEIDLLEGCSCENDYEKIINRPYINGEELIGDKSFEDLGRNDITNGRIKDIVDSQFDLIFGG